MRSSRETESEPRRSGLVAAIVVAATAWTLLWPAIGSSQTRLDGHGSDSIVRPFAIGPNLPLLDGFFFRFGPPLGETSDTDHHLETIEVSPFRPGPVQLTLTYRDRNGDDPFAYIASFHGRMGSGIVSGEVEIEEGKICAQVCSASIERPSRDHVFVLRGFALQARKTKDAHVRRIGVFEEAGMLFLVFETEEGGLLSSFKPPLGGRVSYSYLPASMVRDLGTARGISVGAGRSEIPAGPSVLRGFDLRFRDGYRHVREVGVTTPDDGRVEVFLNDRKSDDRIEWVVDWALLEREGVLEPR